MTISLRISYDALSHDEQQMFLDVACFFVIISKYLEKTLTFYVDFWKALGWRTVYTNLRSLEEKSLIRIDDSGSYCELWMHDHLRDLGRQIVEDECPLDPGKRSRLWCQEDVVNVLEHKEEMPEVRGLMLTQLELQHTDNLALMLNLKYLFCRDLRGKITILPKKLRYLVSDCDVVNGSLDGYLSLPPTFGQLQFLCYLDIVSATLDELSSLPERLVSLSVRYCLKLKKFLNMSHMTKLEKFELSECWEVEELPSFPESLIHIKVDDCHKLQMLPSMSHMIKLETLQVSSCNSLAQLSELNWMQSLRELILYWCANLKELTTLPNSLIHIEVEKCHKLQKLSSMSHMIKLETLHVFSCDSLAQLPELNSMQSLRQLTLVCCVNLNELPPLPKGLRKLKIGTCINLKELPPLPKGLRELTLDGCTNLKELPPLPKGLRKLTLDRCWNLKELPPLPESLINLSTLRFPLLQINASQPSNRDEGKHMTSEPNNETNSSRTMEPSPCFSLQNFFMEKGKSSVPPPADPNYENPHNLNTALSLALPVPECPPMTEASPSFSVQNFFIEQGESSFPPPADPNYENPHNLNTALPLALPVPECPSMTEASSSFSVQNFFIEQGEFSVPPPADPDYEIPHNVDIALSLALPVSECPPMTEASPSFLVQNFFMEQGESSVPPLADPDYEIPHNVDIALSLSLPVPDVHQ